MRICTVSVSLPEGIAVNYLHPFASRVFTASAGSYGFFLGESAAPRGFGIRSFAFSPFKDLRKITEPIFRILLDSKILAPRLFEVQTP